MSGVRPGLTALKRAHVSDPMRMPWGMAVLLSYAMVAVGRVQEVVPPLAEVRIGLMLGILGVLLWLGMPGGLRTKMPWDFPVVKYVMLTLLLAIVTVPLAVWPGGSFAYVSGVHLKTVFLFLMVIAFCRSVADVRRMFWMSCLALALLTLSGIANGTLARRAMIDPMLAPGLDADQYEFVSKTYDPNDLALLLAIILPLLAHLFTTSRVLMKIALSAMMGVLMYGIVVTQSRGGFLALLIVGALILRRSMVPRRYKLLIAGVALIIFTLFASSAFWERIQTIWDPQTEYDRQAGGRTEIWKTGLMIMATHPWGVGIDGFNTAEGLSHGGSGKWAAPHNSFLQVGTELGIAGLILFVLMLKHTFGLVRAAQRQLGGRAPALKARPFARRPGSGARAASVAASPPPDPARVELHGIVSALEICLIGFTVGAIFLSLAYTPMLYVLMALAVVCDRLKQKMLNMPAAVPPMLRRQGVRYA